MTSRERVKAMLEFEPVDQVPLEYHPCKRGLYEHGEAFRSLMKEYPGDFQDFSNGDIPVIPADAYDRDGSYHEFRKDEWGVTWEYRIFSMTGHPCGYPLKDWAALDTYRCPPHRLAEEGALEAYKKQIAEIKQNSYAKDGWFGFFEKMHALRPFEDVLMDIYEGGQEINRLADMLVDYQMEELRLTCAAGVDAVQFGDDFGTARAMLMSPEIWRNFFKPRYQKMIQYAKEQGKAVFFHTCGSVWPILEDLKEIGVDAVWPQLTAYNVKELAAKLRELHLACALHIDRAGVMTSGTPEEVRRAVHMAARIFDVKNGGAFFYVETDHGFPLENIRALLQTIALYRK